MNFFTVHTIEAELVWKEKSGYPFSSCLTSSWDALESFFQLKKRAHTFEEDRRTGESRSSLGLNPGGKANPLRYPITKPSAHRAAGIGVGGEEVSEGGGHERRGGGERER
nr:hypothetical protein Iba_chr07aCG2570 [Ipomoea batatas]